MGLSTSPGHAFAHAPPLGRAPLTLQLASVLLLLLVLPGPASSAQFNATWLASVQGQVASVSRGRYGDILFASFRRHWPLGKHTVHRVVPVGALRACLLLMGSLGTEDLEPAAREMQAFVDALPTTPVDVQNLVRQEEGDETSTLEILLTVGYRGFWCVYHHSGTSSCTSIGRSGRQAKSSLLDYWWAARYTLLATGSIAWRWAQRTVQPCKRFLR